MRVSARVYGGGFLLLLLLTRLASYIMLSKIPENGIFILEDLFGGIGFINYFNTGIAFSLPSGGFLIYVIVLLLLGFIGYLFYKEYYSASRSIILWSYILIMAGGISNIFDRIYYSGVHDYIQIFQWPVFNVADSCIVVGVIVLLWKEFNIKKV